MSNLSHWGRNKISAILQTTFSNTFSCKKIAVVWFKLQWILLPAAQWKTDSMIRLGAQQTKTHYLITNDDQLYRYKYVALGLNELTRNIIYITYIYICIYEYIYVLKIRYLSLQVIDNKHYHKTETLHIGCNFWKSIWVKITMFYHIHIYYYYKMLAIFMICWLSPLCSDVTNERAFTAWDRGYPSSLELK